ncbi:MAG TPA: LysR family transcriptional regulator [Actinomycetospora sp.]|uniref:LysR family transcriptional regulator n=1 Tax=Actinomycetospora sp. TaxID=1872135 RepID=UPI002F3E547F
MELRQLEYVIAVAEERHFGRAATRMHVRQQSVSEQIRRLERELGAPLFARTSRRVQLTPVGEAFLPEARATVAAAHRARDTARRAGADGPAGVRVGYAEDLGTDLFARAAAAHPPVRVVPVPLSSPEQLAAVVEGRLDAGWVWEPALGPELDSALVGRELAVIVLAADDPLAAGDELEPAALSGRPLAVVPREVNPWLHDRFVAGLRERGADVTATYDAVRLDRLVPLVLAGAAFGITQGRSLAGGVPPGVVARPLAGEPPLLVEHRLVWRRDATDPAVARLAALAV